METSLGVFTLNILLLVEQGSQTQIDLGSALKKGEKTLLLNFLLKTKKPYFPCLFFELEIGTRI